RHGAKTSECGASCGPTITAVATLAIPREGGNHTIRCHPANHQCGRVGDKQASRIVEGDYVWLAQNGGARLTSIAVVEADVIAVACRSRDDSCAYLAEPAVLRDVDVG